MMKESTIEQVSVFEDNEDAMLFEEHTSTSAKQAGQIIEKTVTSSSQQPNEIGGTDEKSRSINGNI